MNLSTKQKVMVGKDRAIDELYDIIRINSGYWDLSPERSARIKTIANLLTMDDDSEDALKEADRLGFINGEEELFYLEK